MSKKIDLIEFAAAVGEGLSTRELGARFGIPWQKAQQIRKELLAAKDLRAAPAEPETEELAAADHVEPEKYDLTMTVPGRKIEGLIRTLGPVELLEAVLACDVGTKAYIFERALQHGLEERMQNVEETDQLIDSSDAVTASTERPN